MAEYRYNFSDLINARLSPSSMAHAVNDTAELPACGGIALYLTGDQFAVTFADALTDEAKDVLDDLIAEHSGDGPDTIVDLATRQEQARLAAEAAEAEASA